MVRKTVSINAAKVAGCINSATGRAPSITLPDNAVLGFFATDPNATRLLKPSAR